MERKILYGYSAAVIVLLGVGVTAWWNTTRFESTFHRVERTYTITIRLAQVLTDVLAMQSSTRGFVLTGDEAMLLPYTAGTARLDSALAQLRELTAGNPERQGRVAELAAAVADATAIMRERVEARRARGLDAAADTASFLRGQQAVNHVRRVVEAINRESVDQLKPSYLATRRAARVSLALILAAVVVSTALVVLAGALLRRDFAARRRVEQVLEHERHLLAELMDNSTERIYFKDAASRFVRVNRGVLDALGLERPEQVLGRTDADFFSAEHAQQARADERQVLETGRPLTREEKETWPDGRVTWALTVKLPLRDESGAVIGTFGLTRDITGRKRAEEALRASEAEYRTLFESIDEGFCIIEVLFDERERPVDLRFLRTNPAFEKQTGLAGIEGKRVRELALPLEAYWFETYGRIARTGAPERFQNEAAGLRRWYDVYAFRYGEPQHRQVAILFNDITARKATEERLAALNADLRRQTAALEAANAELEAFSYSVSHDLRAPLRHVNGFASMLERHAAAALDEKGRRYVTTIRDAATQMGRLIDDLLAFSRIGRTTLAPAELDHDALLAGVLRDGRYDAERRLIVWEISPLPRVHADAPLLRQVWSNLIDNAVKYSRHATPPRIAIGCQTTDGAAPEHVFCVRDNGVGFDPAFADKLFGVFQRLHPAAQFEGTGIGLANVRRIVARHGGRTWAESCPGAGASFFFTLPAAAAPADAATNSSAATSR